jgi:hypothetical protein
MRTPRSKHNKIKAFKPVDKEKLWSKSEMV